MAQAPSTKLFEDLQPQGTCLQWAPQLRNSIGSETPRFSDERQFMHPWAAKLHVPKWVFADRLTIRQRVATVSRVVWAAPNNYQPKHERGKKENLVKGSPKGFIGRDAARRIRNIINDWTQAVNCGSSWAKREGADHGIYFSFCTLTLPVPQFHGDKQLKQDLLNPFIKALQRDHGVVNYLWRAEPQRNRNIHFHLFLDRFIEYDLVARYWEYHLEFLGYITAYMEQSGSLFPPATQIISVPKEGQLRDYIAKYLSKAQSRRRSVLPSPEGKVTRISYWGEGIDKAGITYEYEVRPIEGRVWGCSDRLRNLKPFNVLVSDVTAQWILYMEKVKAAHAIVKKFGTVLVGNMTEHLRQWDQWTWRAFYWWHVDQFKHLYCGQQERPPDRPDSITEILQACCSGIRKVINPAPNPADLAPVTIATTAASLKPRSLDPLLTIPF